MAGVVMANAIALSRRDFMVHPLVYQQILKTKRDPKRDP
jgi:hypothetical protein